MHAVQLLDIHAKCSNVHLLLHFGANIYYTNNRYCNSHDDTTHLGGYSLC